MFRNIKGFVVGVVALAGTSTLAADLNHTILGSRESSAVRLYQIDKTQADSGLTLERGATRTEQDGNGVTINSSRNTIAAAAVAPISIVPVRVGVTAQYGQTSLDYDTQSLVRSAADTHSLVRVMGAYSVTPNFVAGAGLGYRTERSTTKLLPTETAPNKLDREDTFVVPALSFAVVGEAMELAFNYQPQVTGKIKDGEGDKSEIAESVDVFGRGAVSNTVAIGGTLGFANQSQLADDLTKRKDAYSFGPRIEFRATEQLLLLADVRYKTATYAKTEDMNPDNIATTQTKAEVVYETADGLAVSGGPVVGYGTDKVAGKKLANTSLGMIIGGKWAF